MDAKVEQFYRSIYADLTVDREEAQELKDFLTATNPPPDKNVWLRATAFRIGCEFLSEGNKDNNVALLRAINAIVHAIETTRMLPKDGLDGSNFDEDKLTELYTSFFGDLVIDKEENQELMTFFGENGPPKDKLVSCRASAFRIACDFLSEDDKAANIKLLKCINVLVHDFEMTCLQPRPYVLRMEVPPRISIASVGLDASLEQAVQHMWDLDVNRLKPDVDYVVNVQGGKKPWQRGDEAPEPLFTSVNTLNFRSRPTYRAFVALLDNYIAETGVAEKVTDVERREVSTFLSAILNTAPMQFCHKYCHAQKPNDIPRDIAGFKKLLHRIWFELYRRNRNGRDDSSGFEHVFVGEIKDGKVSGMHNWIQLYMEEQKGALDYKGYIKPKSRTDAVTDADDRILTLQFDWNGVEKSVGSSFIGTSPEFEMAIFTTCFLVGGEDNILVLKTEPQEEYELSVKCFSMARGKIGTSYPEARSHYEG
mmetsp:Transcript_11821/g.20028  ORF Transcript_11821/g.20028 Transcript_11821/m.20028 type:complete len:480 (-) Transcript_11821:1052-2491(-)